ncbi:MAG: hypothetical protein BM562_08795 [Alphaproteobacteria bacterium MedPE-SWcel]|nr:MAG: hypothetical protein BM562_08795 [Alphaproteobacteria bacterium MedPE-SWcel]
MIPSGAILRILPPAKGGFVLAMMLVISGCDGYVPRSDHRKPTQPDAQPGTQSGGQSGTGLYLSGEARVGVVWGD